VDALAATASADRQASLADGTLVRPDPTPDERDRSQGEPW